jgi:hypothetical protein
MANQKPMTYVSRACGGRVRSFQHGHIIEICAALECKMGLLQTISETVVFVSQVKCGGHCNFKPTGWRQFCLLTYWYQAQVPGSTSLSSMLLRLEQYQFSAQLTALKVRPP